MYPVLRTAVAMLAGLTSLGAAADVNVYSYRQPFLIEPLFEQFTEQTGIDVNVVFAKEGLTERLKREGINSPADLVMTADIGRLDDLLAADVVQPVITDTLMANIPEQYRHPEGLWYGLTLRARIIVASRDRVEDGAISSYEDLADPQWKSRICTRSGKHVYNVALVASMIAHHGEQQTEQWLQGVKDNLARKPQGGDRDQVKAIAQGECDIALVNSYYMGNMLSDPEQKDWAESVDIIFPNQADRGTHVNISGVAMTKSAPNKDDAIQLMEFLSENPAQQIYAEQDFEYPVKPGVPASETVKSWGDFNADELPLSEIAQLRADAIRLIDRVDYDN